MTLTTDGFMRITGKTKSAQKAEHRIDWEKYFPSIESDSVIRCEHCKTYVHTGKKRRPKNITCPRCFKHATGRQTYVCQECHAETFSLGTVVCENCGNSYYKRNENGKIPIRHIPYYLETTIGTRILYKEEGIIPN